MNNTKLGIIIALAIIVVLVIGLKQKPYKADNQIPIIETGLLKETDEKPVAQGKTMPALVRSNLGLPLLVDLGADKCIPCIKMAPILKELKEKYAGKFAVEYINVRKNFKAGEEYGIRLIPTQIFYDPSGKELYRHEGFFSKEGILSKWEELGFDFDGGPEA